MLAAGVIGCCARRDFHVLWPHLVAGDDPTSALDHIGFQFTQRRASVVRVKPIAVFTACSVDEADVTRLLAEVVGPMLK